MKTALIDADIITYLAAYYSMQKFDDGEVWVDIEAAKEEVKRVTDEWVADAGCDAPLMVLSPPDRTNYRKIIWPEYKTHRKASAKPPHLGAVAEYVAEAYDSTYIPYLEGDDVIGILHTRDPDNTVIVSTDKDMATVPGYHYNPNRTYGMGPVEISQAQAKQWLFTQILTGDPTDGYKGATRVGPKSAEKILRPHYSCVLSHNDEPTYYFDEECAFNDAVAAYIAAGDTVEDFVRNYSMAQILTNDLYDESTRTVYLPTAQYGTTKWLQLLEK